MMCFDETRSYFAVNCFEVKVTHYTLEYVQRLFEFSNQLCVSLSHQMFSKKSAPFFRHVNFNFIDHVLWAANPFIHFIRRSDRGSEHPYANSLLNGCHATK